jgi:hypothetical protein
MVLVQLFLLFIQQILRAINKFQKLLYMICYQSEAMIPGRDVTTCCDDPGTDM